MSWTLTDTHGGAVDGPFDRAHDAIAGRRSCRYLRVEKVDAGRYELDAGFSALDHEHFALIETAA